MKKKFQIRITSYSKPPGLAPYSLTPSSYDYVAERKFETAEDFKQALIDVGVRQDGIDNTLKLLTQPASIVDEFYLTEESAKGLMWNW
jgi:hypothetical protein